MKYLKILFFLGAFGCSMTTLQAQAVLFDFNDASVYSPLPISLTEGGITAHFSATGQGYSIQSTSTATVVPSGFTGNFIFPSSVYASDLLIRFDQAITRFSIWYAPQELACDTSATMRVTAYRQGNYVITDTKVAANPGTWPVDSVACQFSQGFDSVVVHFDSHPAMCQDWGPIFIADNMVVTPLGTTGLEAGIQNQVDVSTLVTLYLWIENHRLAPVTFVLFDLTGKEIWRERIVGKQSIPTDALAPGMYGYMILDGGNRLSSGKVIHP